MRTIADRLLPHHLRLLRWGCAAACAALAILPAVAQASKYDAELAPVNPRPGIQVVAAEAHHAAAPAPASAPAATPQQRSGRSGSSAPSWLSGGSSHSRHH